METTGINWQDSYQIKNCSGYRWQIATLNLQMFRQAKEWHVCWYSNHEYDAHHVEITALSADEDSAPDSQHERYVLQAHSARIRLNPRTADRSVVIRPRDPFILPSREQATLFVSTPLWIEITVDDPPRVLREMPVRRPSDTWFGPSPLSGELCYDSRTRGVMDLDHLDYQPNRVITPLLINNLAETPLTLERVCLPVPLLSIYQAQNNHLWTESLSLTREEDGEMAALKIDENPPSQARKAKKISEPRKTRDKYTLIRAFGGLFN